MVGSRPRPRCWLPGLDLAPADEFVAAALGADPGIRDARFDSTPLGWAHHFGQEDSSLAGAGHLAGAGP